MSRDFIGNRYNFLSLFHRTLSEMASRQNLLFSAIFYG
ncbi:hypothetical protein M595_1832 [Lyngbya aestuarii BL J]|uniref:Uncharacterized protein n=1 Tax=Lyngbya aestuarii BL J TaxID=1348334 RepID=U7QLS1_9CYAN|nr:hypothetical protein M595_1832 [Lyngbya aestuarii BL J]